MKKFLKVIAVSLALVSIFCVSAFAATPQEKIIDVIKESVPARLYNEYKVAIDNLGKQVPVTDEQAETIIALVKDVTSKIDISDIDHLEDLTEADRLYFLEKLDEACELVDVTYTITNSTTPDVVGDIVINFFYNGKAIGDLDTHEVKKTGGEDYPAQSALVLGGVILALAAVAFVGSKKFVLSK